MTSPAAAAGTVHVAGRDVARIGYGLGSLARSAEGDDGFRAGVDLLRHALDAGVSFFDTAQFYENGLANRLLAAAFGDRRDEVLYVSKVGARPQVGGPVPMRAAQRPQELREDVEENLRTLGTDHLDVVYLRRMDMAPGVVIGDDLRAPLDDQLAELVRLRDAGTIGAIGVSHVSLEQLQQALPAGIAAVSNIHNLLRRDDEPLMRLCEQHDIVWSPYFPLGGGFANLPKVVEVPAVQQAAERLGATPQQVGLAWLLARSPQSVVIAGTSSIGHLDENIATAAVRLDDATLADLDAAAPAA